MFYSRLSYSFGNEDWVTEQLALDIQKESRVLCITASGDRPLNLLSTECHSLVSIDANPLQNALLDLKKTALAHFSYDDYCGFLGLEPMHNRLKLYAHIAPLLSHESQRMWHTYRHHIAKGILFQGALERLGRASARIICLCRRRKIKQLFTFEDATAQAAFIRQEFDTPLWRRLFILALHPKLIGHLLDDPGLYAYVGKNTHIGHHLYDCIHQGLQRVLAKESILLSLIFKGSIDKEHLPPYLSRAGIESIRPQLGRLHSHTVDVLSFLQQTADASFDRFSLSDIASYMPYSAFEQMLSSMIRVAIPGARFCIRQFLSNYEIPPHLAPRLKREHALEEHLSLQDRCCVYRFFVGTVHPQRE